MLSLFNSWFVDQNKKFIKKQAKIVKQINNFEEHYASFTQDDLKQHLQSIRDQLSLKADIDQFLPEVFAIVREASKRTLGLRHFDAQLLGGIALHQGTIVEMLTGEGKTLVATLPICLNALLGQGVHVVTVNEYLAKRDSQWMGAIYNYLGFSVGFIHDGMNDNERKIAYNCDITYGNNSEFGFDYLRDNMRIDIESFCQRAHVYAIVDEVDSVLIDESRTPLIISGPSEDNINIYNLLNKFANSFILGTHFEIDEKQKTIFLNDVGFNKAEELLREIGLINEGSLFDVNNIRLYHILQQILKAHYLFNENVDYIIKDSQIVIIDEFTGRMMEGRRFSEGLHQALEAKEGLKVQHENQTLASITYQNYFRLYHKLAGMTGTALTEKQEFAEIYQVDVVAIPPNSPLQRKDYHDKIYLKYEDKKNAIVQHVKQCYEKQQPVLIGTVSIEKSELLSKALKQAKIPHKVLNAKYHEQEAHIIANAGRLEAVTIATNMAGRGTDIQLGGSFEELIKDTNYFKLNTEQQEELKHKLLQQIADDKHKILQLGGLCVIGTERHESRRIDNQLRGRSGRQGEIGETIFYISLEDDLMRIFGSSRLEGLLEKLGLKGSESISHSMISKSIEKAQCKVEQFNFEQRKNLLKFDNVINEQRIIIYDQRKEMLNGDIDIIQFIDNNIHSQLIDIFDECCNSKQYKEQWNINFLASEVSKRFNIHDIDFEKELIQDERNVADIKELVWQRIKDHLQKKIDFVSEEQFIKIAKQLIIQILDSAWKRNLLELDYVRSSINLRAYSNKDPYNEYQKESYILFSEMLDNFKQQVVTIINHLEFAV